MAPTARAAILATALLSVLLISPQTVSATDTKLLDFPNCVEQCIKLNGCKDISSAKCMCQAAQGSNMLAKVVGCMRSSCNQQINPKSAFIDVMRAGCSSLKMPIPDEKIALAELQAWQGGGVTLSPSSSTTSKGAAPSESKTQSQSESQRSSATTTSAESSQDRQQSSSTTVPDTTSNLAPIPVPTTTTTTAQAAANTPRPDPREPTDSSPFATPIEAAVGRMEPPSWVWAAGAIAAIGGLR